MKIRLSELYFMNHAHSHPPPDHLLHTLWKLYSGNSVTHEDGQATFSWSMISLYLFLLSPAWILCLITVIISLHTPSEKPQAQLNPILCQPQTCMHLSYYLDAG